MTQATPRTLSERLSEGKLPVGEALHLAMTLADALRKMHDSGRVYGALTPSSIRPTGTGVDLAAAPEPGGSVTPYTAPEVLHGKSPDTRADIFAFGAILFEMLTGRRAFDGDNEASLTAALTGSAPPSSGSPLVDRLVASCVAKDPAVRCPAHAKDHHGAQAIERGRSPRRDPSSPARSGRSPASRRNPTTGSARCGPYGIARKSHRPDAGGPRKSPGAIAGRAPDSAHSNTGSRQRRKHAARTTG
jgi:hypothetical protein